MALTQDFKQTVVDRVRRDPEFAKALLDEAATLFLNGEADTARLVLRDLVNATVGFEALAAETAKPAMVVVSNGKPGAPVNYKGSDFPFDGVGCASDSRCYAVGSSSTGAVVVKVKS